MRPKCFILSLSKFDWGKYGINCESSGVLDPTLVSHPSGDANVDKCLGTSIGCKRRASEKSWVRISLDPQCLKILVSVKFVYIKIDSHNTEIEHVGLINVMIMIMNVQFYYEGRD